MMVMVSCKVCSSVSLTGWHWVGPRMGRPPFLVDTKEACCNAWAYKYVVILPICDLLSLLKTRSSMIWASVAPSAACRCWVAASHQIVICFFSSLDMRQPNQAYLYRANIFGPHAKRSATFSRYLRKSLCHVSKPTMI